MEMENVTAYDCEWFWKHVDVKKCVNVTKTITHSKLKPNCTTIPKYHCTEKWEIDGRGDKVGYSFVLQSSFEMRRKMSEKN